MLYRDGEMEEWQLEEALRDCIDMYAKDGESYVSYFDVPKRKVMYVKFVFLAEQWIFTDIVDKAK